ncbi:MAG: hypothetical protein CR997_11740 [Acidobacteria bacterium]|nr:MAG: hypothetical protein CR997_11740 [Acidobacteriota bacterium]
MSNNNTGANLGFEDKLWMAADKLCGTMDSAEYKHVVLGLIFLKYISDSFLEKYEALQAEEFADPEDRDEYLTDNVFWVPTEARWHFLQGKAKTRKALGNTRKPPRFVNQKRFLDFSGQPQIVEQRNQVEIKSESDAVYVDAENTLYFKDVAKIKLFVPGIEILHRKATQEEVDDFLGRDFITLESYEAASVCVLNRKRIADIGKKIHNLTSEKMIHLIDYAKEQSGIELTEDGTFKISYEIDLKNLLFAMDQRYYYADVYEENRVANSVRIVS